MRVTTSWTPGDLGLYLQYEFETTDDLIIVNPATSGDSQTNAFGSDDGTFSIFWRYQDTGETGRLSCPAYPGGDATATPNTYRRRSNTNGDRRHDTHSHTDRRHDTHSHPDRRHDTHSHPDRRHDTHSHTDRRHDTHSHTDALATR